MLYVQRMSEWLNYDRKSKGAAPLATLYHCADSTMTIIGQEAHANGEELQTKGLWRRVTDLRIRIRLRGGDDTITYDCGSTSRFVCAA
jgi:hypothetical protein